MSRCLVLLLLLGLRAPARASSEEPVDPEVPALRASYEYGRYEEVIERAGSRIDRGLLSEEELAELHKLAGLSAFNLGRTGDAERHFRALLRLDPDFKLDPFAVPPPVVEYLEGIREEMAAELELVRQERRLRLERERTETERRERERVAAEEQRRRLEVLSRQVTVRRVEKRSFLVNFVPFGAGQFQQGRNGLGTVLAATEGALAVTSVIAFFAYESLFETGKVVVDDIRRPTEVPVRYIPTERLPQAKGWQWLKWGSAMGFYALYTAGVVDALVQHQEQVVETSIEEIPSPPPPAAPADTALKARLHILPLPGGAGAGFSLAF
jgi:tetratricopeptide (TPR) repeat protein